MKQRTHYSYYRPKNLNIEEVIRTNAPDEKPLFYKYYKYIITKIIGERLQNEKYSNEDFVRLKMEYLRNIITTKNTKRIITNLVNWNIIEVDKSYVVGSSSRGYRLCAEYRNVNYEVISIEDATMSNKIYEKTFVNRLDEQNTGIYNDANSDNDINIYTPYGVTFSALLRNLVNNLDSLSIDFDKALDFVHSNYPENEHFKYIAFIHKFQNSEHFFAVSQNVGRIYTTITNCPKVLLQFISIDGKKLKEIDIANSQPLFFNFLINDYLKETGTFVTPDIELYREKTMKGELYQFLLSKCHKIKTTDEIKDFLFRFVYYGKNSRGTYNSNNEPYSVNKDSFKMNEIKTLFQSIFPTVFEIINYYKKGDFANLSIKLQNAESSFIIPVAMELSKNFPLFTKHDSLLMTEENLLTAVNALTEAFQQQGMTAKCRLK